MTCRPRRWLWGLIPLTLPLLGAAFFSAPLLEQRLTGDAAAALRSGGVKWVNIEVDGRDARLSGEAPSADAIRQAVQVVAGVHGIRLVDSRDVTLAARAINVPAARQDAKPTPAPALPPVAEEAPPEPPSVADATPAPPPEPAIEVAPLPPPPAAEAADPPVTEATPPPLAEATPPPPPVAEAPPPDPAPPVVTEAEPAPPVVTEAEPAPPAVAEAPPPDPAPPAITDTPPPPPVVEVPPPPPVEEVPPPPAAAEAAPPPPEPAPPAVAEMPPPPPPAAAEAAPPPPKPAPPAVAEAAPTPPSQPLPAPALPPAAAPVHPPGPVPGLPAAAEPPPSATAADSITTGSLDCPSRFRRLLDLQVIDYGYNRVVAAFSRELIGKLAAVARSCPTVRLEVVGHSDSIGSPTFNRALSERRAAVIVEALVQQGIAADRLIAVGRGESQPLASNRTAEGRARNRRVEWVVDPQGESR